MVDYSNARAFVTTKEDAPGPRPSKYNRGDRVRLVHIEGREDEPKEEGVVLSVDWHDWKPTGDFMYVVEVDEEYRDEFDDGLREMSEDQIESKL